MVLSVVDGRGLGVKEDAVADKMEEEILFDEATRK
jgi:hypothetical protein